MDDAKSFRPFLVPTLALLVVGWAGLFLLFNFALPTLWARWGFFALVILAFTGAALPLAYLLNRFFPSTPPAEPGVIARQALWVGVYFAALAWLSVGRLLSFSLGLWLALGMAAIEYLMRVRETTGPAASVPPPAAPAPEPPPAEPSQDGP